MQTRKTAVKRKVINHPTMVLGAFILLAFFDANSIRVIYAGSQDSFPRKPIKVVVYMKAGGLIDVTSRKFVEIASRYTDATFVVENKPGAGGIVAMNSVLNQPADGHTLFACTKSNIAKFVSSGCDSAVESFHWLALLMRDPECIITNKSSQTPDFESLVASAKSQPGQTNWLGPAKGGLDHIMALKTWSKLGISAKWIPHDNGGQALAALLGKQGTAYVGNPRETMGNSQLQIAAVSSVDRLPQFPNAPTFNELGIAGLDHENMWRGFAIKKGTPENIVSWFDRIIQQVTDDPDWRNYWESGGIEVVHWHGDQFKEVVTHDREEFRNYLSDLKIINTVHNGRGLDFSSGMGLASTIAILILASILFSFAYAKKFGSPVGEVLIPSLVVSLSVLFWIQTSAFPNEGNDIGAKLLPRIYAVFILGLVGVVFLKPNVSNASKPPATHSSSFAMVVLALFLYPLASTYLGFYVATLLFLIAVMKSLRVRNWKLSFCIVGSWLLIAYGFFNRLLFVRLPIGNLWES